MPQRKSGVKELRSNRVRRLRNLDVKTDLRKTTKDFLAAVQSKKAKETEKMLQAIFSKLDKAAKKNVIHKNTVARRKSRFSKLALQVSKAK